MTTGPGVPAGVDAAPSPGAKSGTVWIWLLAFTPIAQFALLVPTTIYFLNLMSVDPTDTRAVEAAALSPLLLVTELVSFAIVAISIVFPVLDWRELSRRGVQRPFHWAWSFSVLAVSSPIVYVIGRTVVTRRRTGRGLAPLWVFLALEILYFLAGVVIVVIASIALLALLGGAASTVGDFR